MKQRWIAVVLTFAGFAAFAEEQPPVRFVVVVREAGKIVECPSAVGVLGQLVRVPLSNGRWIVTALAGPRDGEGRSKITIRFETPALSAGGLEGAYEMTHAANLANGSPSFEHSAGEREKTFFKVIVTSPPLLATTRAEPSWKQHLSKSTSESSMTRAECKSLGERAASTT